MSRKFKPLTIYITEEQAAGLKDFSTKSKVNVSELIRTAIDRLLLSEIPTWK